MKNKLLFTFILLLSIICNGCSDDEPQPHNLDVTSIELIDCSNETKENCFDCKNINGYYECSVTTINIRKEQNIKDITAKYLDKKLSVYITLDKDLFPEPYNRVSMVKFSLSNLPKGIYDLDIMVDNVHLTLEPDIWNFK